MDSKWNTQNKSETKWRKGLKKVKKQPTEANSKIICVLEMIWRFNQNLLLRLHFIRVWDIHAQHSVMIKKKKKEESFSIVA